MKVFIGKYPTHRSLYLHTRKMKIFGEDRDSVLAPWFERWNSFIDRHEYLNDWFCKIFNWRQEQIRYVKIDEYDTWGFDSTLALIIAPGLKQLKATKHGAPLVDDEDVPEEIRSTSAKPKENYYDVDEFHFDRWDYVLDEMIFAFDALNTDWESQFHSGSPDFEFIALDENHEELSKGEKGKYYKMVRGENDTWEFDSEGYNAMLNRMKNGFRLFGKYYMGLWD